MKINIQEHIRNRTTASHLVLECLTDSAMESIMDDYHQKDDGMLDVTLLINGKEVPIESFVEHWESQVDNILKEMVKEHIKEKFGDISNLLHDLQGRLEQEVDDRKSPWELANKGNKMINEEYLELKEKLRIILDVIEGHKESVLSENGGSELDRWLWKETIDKEKKT